MKIRSLNSSIEPLENRIAPATIYAADNADNLIHFDSSTPGTVPAANVVPFTGLSASEHIRGIDFRPSTGELYALGITDGANDSGRLFKVNLTTGALTPVGPAFFTTFASGDDYAFDFNPVVDKIRIVGDTGSENLRVDPDTGALISQDGNVTAGNQIDGVAYTNNFEGATKTTLYGISKATGHLVTIGGINGSPSPNGGVVTQAPNGLGFTPASFKIGFDIESRTGTAYAIMSNAGINGLYTIDLTSGVATLQGAIGGNPQIEGMTVAPSHDLKILSPTMASYTDQDGDVVTVKITGAAPGAALTKSDFRFSTGQFGSQLKSLDLSAATHQQQWAKASVTINAVPAKIGNLTRGDDFANVGYINGTGVDLGTVVVNGDLGQIDAGDANTATPGLAGLAAASMGVIFNSQLPSGGILPDQKSDIVGKLGALIINGDFSHELISVTGGANGSIGNITIAGDIIGTGLFVSSGITATGGMGKIILKGNLYGGFGTNVGSVVAGGTIATVTVLGSIYGGSSAYTGNFEAANIGNVVIKGSIYGGTADHTGMVHATTGSLGNVTISGSIVGGALSNDGDLDSGIVFSSSNSGKVGNVTVGGSLVGTNGSFSGSIFSGNILGNVTIGGSVRGGSASDSGSIESGGNMGLVKIGGDLSGGTADYAGSVSTFGSGSIGSVTILGNVVGNSSGTVNGILSTKQLGAVKISGSLEASGPNGIRISAEGETTLNAKTVSSVAAIASVSILGNVRNALILGGFSTGGVATNPDATIGAVTVGQNWISSSLAAGVVNLGLDNATGGAGSNADNVNFGDTHDFKITSMSDSPDATGLKLISKIASVTIKGYAIGTPNPLGATDSFGIVAQQVGVVKVANRAYTLAAGTDLAGQALGVTGDFFVHEVA